METVIVYSPVQDKNIQQNLSGSPIWGEAYHESDLTDTQKKFASMYQYTMVLYNKNLFICKKYIPKLFICH